MKKVFCINSMYKRKDNLARIIPNILKQADVVHVNLIGYKNKAIPDVLRKGKVKVKHLDKAGSETRFLYYNDYKDAYYFTIDDDILYPSDYSEKMIKKMKEYNDKVVCTVHGTIPNFQKKKRIWDGRKSHPFQKGLIGDVRVIVAGVGTSCFNTSVVKINMEDFTVPNISDAFVCTFLHKQNIPVVCIARKGGWLRALNEYGVHIWGTHPHDKIDEIIKEAFGL